MALLYSMDLAVVCWVGRDLEVKLSPRQPTAKQITTGATFIFKMADVAVVECLSTRGRGAAVARCWAGELSPAACAKDLRRLLASFGSHVFLCSRL